MYFHSKFVYNYQNYDFEKKVFEILIVLWVRHLLIHLQLKKNINPLEVLPKILNENTQSEQKEEIENLIKLSNFSPGISLEILTSSGIELYIDLLETFLKKEKISNCSKKIISNTKNQITNIWIVEFLLKRLLSNCLKYSINDQLVINNLILNEKKIIIHILNIKNINELLELLDDLNYRLTRVKTFNSSLEFEIFQFLNRFH